jgi:hypothetical protein
MKGKDLFSAVLGMRDRMGELNTDVEVSMSLGTVAWPLRFFFFFVGLEFELRTSHLHSRCSTA